MSTASNLSNVLQAVPAKANEIIDKLSDEKSLNTRNQLASELIYDLRLYADLEEQHLFPVLRKSAEAKALLPRSVNDNKQLRAKLADLESQPSDSDEFLQQISVLKKGLEQRLREERKDLLPAVLKAIDDEEAEEITGRIDAAIREAEEARREQTGEARDQDQARRRERADAAQREVRRAQEAVGEAAQVATESAAETMEAGAEAAREGVRRVVTELTERTWRATSSIGEAMTVQRETIETATQDLRAGADAVASASGAMTEIGSAWTDWLNRNVQTGMRAAQQFSRCRNMKEAAETQRELAREMMQAWLDHITRTLQATQKSTAQALRPLRERVDQRP